MTRMIPGRYTLAGVCIYILDMWAGLHEYCAQDLCYFTRRCMDNSRLALIAVCYNVDEYGYSRNWALACFIALSNGIISRNLYLESRFTCDTFLSFYRADCEHVDKVVHPFDWTFTTDYCGTLVGEADNRLLVRAKCLNRIFMSSITDG
jgi:hypothetical protein